MAKVLLGVLKSKVKKLRLEKEADILGIDVLVFSPKGIQWKARRIRGYLYSNGKWAKTRCPFPAAVYNRIYSNRKRVTAKLEKIIGKDTVFNCITWFDKWKIHSILRKTGVVSALPDTMLYSFDGIEEMLAKHGKIIVKPCRGEFGNSVYRIEAAESGYSLLNNLEISIITESTVEKLLSSIDYLFKEKPFILQQFIPFARYKERVFDIRMYVQKNARGTWVNTGGFCRVAVQGTYITNFSSDLTSINEMVVTHQAINVIQFREMERLSLLTARSIEESIGHLGEICVDFCVDTKGSIWIIEVNGHTQKKLLLRLGDGSLERIRYYYPLVYAQHLAITKNAYLK